MNIRRFAAALFTTAMVVVLSSSVASQVVHAQCNPSDPACGGQEKEKKLSPTETAVPQPTATIVAGPNAALAPISGAAGNAEPGIAGSDLPGASPVGGKLSGWFLAVILIGVLGIGALLWRRNLPLGPPGFRMPASESPGSSGEDFAKFNRQAPPGSSENMTIARGDIAGGKENATISGQDP